ncbi:hypothetical protein [Streptomyces thermodiastaticus]|uniref:hypothetical protein n=1 Tax=Streptomyces thermodiastaticus TaxID=44061 RepID=UPI001678E96A|nr:hypothetical protein [Streptomyces thermodiastaticus]MCE7548584.1 hypothetical protein [Streptomyces thermodiastaticus]GHF81812.1 hypothetical protein GCM10018787_33260 [Streptomyces thermodiastaticus]
MSARSIAVRDRRTAIGRIARSLQRDRGYARPAEVLAAAAAAGLKPSRADVASTLARLGMRRR